MFKQKLLYKIKDKNICYKKNGALKLKKIISITIIIFLISGSFFAMANTENYQEKENNNEYNKEIIESNNKENKLCNCGSQIQNTEQENPKNNYPYYETIEEINKEIQNKQASWTASANPIYQKNEEEKQLLLGAYDDSNPKPGEIVLTSVPTDGGSLPTFFDWRNVHGENYLTPVRSQGGCGSCWAFAAVAAVEGNALAYLNKPNLDLDLSEQDILSCSNAGSCGGGSSSTALDYIKNDGVSLESCFNYQAKDEDDGVYCSDKCSDWQNDAWSVNNVYYVSSPTEDEIKSAILNYGSLSVSFKVYSDFYSYDSGVYEPTTDSHSGWHAVSMVGFGTENGKDYWLCKNSWGTGFGIDGYFKIKRGTCYIDNYIRYVDYPEPPVSMQVSCTDNDGDGYYYWGIGPKPSYCPSSPDISDCDDSDPNVYHGCGYTGDENPPNNPVSPSPDDGEHLSMPSFEDVDVNNDGTVDALDVYIVGNTIVGGNDPGSNDVDVDDDGELDYVDYALIKWYHYDELTLGLEIVVSDPDNDPLDVDYYLDGSYIGEDTNVPSGGTAVFETGPLTPGNTYNWYVKVDDGLNTPVQSSTYSFTVEQEDQLDQQQTQHSGYVSFVSTGAILAQSFKPSLNTLTRVEFYMMRSDGSYPETIHVYIRDDLDGENLTKISISSDLLPTDTHEWFEFDLPDVSVVPDQKYYIFFYPESNGPDYNRYEIKLKSGDLYDGGERWLYIPHPNYGWTEYSDQDYTFKTYGMNSEENNPPEIPVDPSPSDGEVLNKPSFEDADVNGDGEVNVLDASQVGQHLGETGSPGWIPEDVDDDGEIDRVDYDLIYWHLLGGDGPPVDHEIFVSDPDGDSLTVSFYWSDGTLIEQVDTVASDTVVTGGLSNTLSPGVYNWYVVVDDGVNDPVQSGLFTYTINALGDNDPPYPPDDLNPLDGSTDVSINTDLSWTGGDPDGDVVVYDVYFGTDQQMDPEDLKSESQSSTSFDPGSLEYNTYYYWQIIARDTHDEETSSEVFSFKTGDDDNNPPYMPDDLSPVDDAVGVSTDKILSWTGGDPDGDSVVYDVYLDTDENLGLNDRVSIDQTGTIFDYGGFEENTEYFWKIVATDEHGESSETGVYSFTTFGSVGKDFSIEIEPIHNGQIEVKLVNDGTLDLDYVEYNLSVEGMIFHKVDCYETGVLGSLDIGSTEILNTSSLNGFDIIKLTVEVNVDGETETEERLGILLLGFVFLFA